MCWGHAWDAGHPLQGNFHIELTKSDYLVVELFYCCDPINVDISLFYFWKLSYYQNPAKPNSCWEPTESKDIALVLLDWTFLFLASLSLWASANSSTMKADVSAITPWGPSGLRRRRGAHGMAKQTSVSFQGQAKAHPSHSQLLESVFKRSSPRASEKRLGPEALRKGIG